MNPPRYPPVNGPVNTPVNAQALPPQYAVSAAPAEAPVRAGQVLRYLIGMLTAWSATMLACSDVIRTRQQGALSGSVVPLVLTALGGILVLFWLAQATRRFSSKKSLPVFGQPPMSMYPPMHAAQNMPPARPMPSPSMAVPSRHGVATGTPYGSNMPPSPGDLPPDQRDSGQMPAVAPAQTVQASYFLNDALFKLEDPGPTARLFQVRKDQANLCQDSFACDSQAGIYIMTDGVTGSLMSAPWARLVAREYVKFRRHLRDPFGDEDAFRIWHSSCMHQWRDWMYDTRASVLGASGNVVKTATVPWEKSIDFWHERINSKPAQTTAVACSIQRDSTGRDKIQIHMSAIGDSECLVFRSNKRETPELLTAFPLDRLKQFNDHPNTLTTDTADAIVLEMFKNIHHVKADVKRGDIVVLATDSVAQWLMHLSAAQDTSRMQPPPPSLREIFALASQDEFARIVEQECDAGRLERDDETLLIIPIS